MNIHFFFFWRSNNSVPNQRFQGPEVVMSRWCVLQQRAAPQTAKRTAMNILGLKLLHPSEISNTGMLSDVPQLTGNHLQDSPCVVCSCTSVWHHGSGLGRRKQCQMLTCTDGAALRVMKTSHSKADIQWFFPARLSFTYPDFIRLALHLPPHQYFFLPSLISTVWIKILVQWPQTSFWLFSKCVFHGHFIVKSNIYARFPNNTLLCTFLTTHTDFDHKKRSSRWKYSKKDWILLCFH